jgi:DNA-binding NarL/FixJ family response regulator
MGLVDAPDSERQKPNSKRKTLTPRELEILKMVAQGHCNKSIATELDRSIKTVDHHREHIMRKLGIHGVAGLTRYAFSAGLM